MRPERPRFGSYPIKGSHFGQGHRKNTQLLRGMVGICSSLSELSLGVKILWQSVEIRSLHSTVTSCPSHAWKWSPRFALWPSWRQRWRWPVCSFLSCSLLQDGLGISLLPVTGDLPESSSLSEITLSSLAMALNIFLSTPEPTPPGPMHPCIPILLPQSLNWSSTTTVGTCLS